MNIDYWCPGAGGSGIGVLECPKLAMVVGLTIFLILIIGITIQRHIEKKRGIKNNGLLH